MNSTLINKVRSSRLLTEKTIHFNDYVDELRNFQNDLTDIAFEKEEGDAVSLYPPKEVADYTTIGVSMSENPLIENMYAILYNDEYGTPDFTIQLEYSDGSAEELTFHITLQ